MLEVEAVNFKIKKARLSNLVSGPAAAPHSPAGGIGYSHFPVWESINLPLCEAV